jgi:hypothetical protein
MGRGRRIPQITGDFLREETHYTDRNNTVVYISDPKKRRELTMVMTQEEAGRRYCPFSMGNDKSHCEGSGCMAWRWLPKQQDARTAVGFCSFNGG